MKIDEVIQHLGEEWACRGRRYRLEEIVTKREEYGSHWHPRVRYRRRIRATELDRATGQPQGEGILEARAIEQPWAEYESSLAAAQAEWDRKTAVARRLNVFLTNGETITARRWCRVLDLTIDQAEQLADKLEEKTWPGT